MSIGADPAGALRALEQRARKRFGQHFLTDPSITARIVRAAGVQPGDEVVEIGPGLGILTESLREAGARVTAVELDRDLAARLRELLPDVRLIEADAMGVDWPALGVGPGARLVANLPYNVGTHLVMAALRSPGVFRTVTVMLQREVVARLVAGPGDDAYGALSVERWLWADARVAMAVPPGAFHPPPKVHSAVVHLTPWTPDALGDVPRRAVEGVVRAAFASRRKTLRNTLGAAWGKPLAESVLASVDIDPGLRAEVLAPAAFVALARRAHTPEKP